MQVGIKSVMGWKNCYTEGAETTEKTKGNLRVLCALRGEISGQFYKFGYSLKSKTFRFELFFNQVARRKARFPF